MRRLAAPLVLFVGIACTTAPGPGMRIDRVPTTALPSAPECLVVVPPSYDRSPHRRYPVLYFLHDGYGDGRTLVRRGVAAEALERMREGTLPEFFIIAPDGPGSWFSDSYDGKHRFEELLVGDLPRAIEERYRVIRGRGGRGITGVSMGGFGAVKTALQHPDFYGSVSALSGALIPIGWSDIQRYSTIARFTLMRVFGHKREANSLAENDPWNILWGLCFETPPFPVQLRAGTEDFYGLEGVAAQYGMLLNERGVPTTVILERGGHDWDYWKRALPELMAWHAARFEYDAE